MAAEEGLGGVTDAVTTPSSPTRTLCTSASRTSSAHGPRLELQASAAARTLSSPASLAAASNMENSADSNVGWWKKETRGKAPAAWISGWMGPRIVEDAASAAAREARQCGAAGAGCWLEGGGTTAGRSVANVDAAGQHVLLQPRAQMGRSKPHKTSSVAVQRDGPWKAARLLLPLDDEAAHAQRAQQQRAEGADGAAAHHHDVDDGALGRRGAFGHWLRQGWGLTRASMCDGGG